MLRFLRIEHLAVIDALQVEFEPGLNVLTGETGAGKSMLVEAVGLLMGGRASPDLIRTGETQAQVQAEFDVADLNVGTTNDGTASEGGTASGTVSEGDTTSGGGTKRERPRREDSKTRERRRDEGLRSTGLHGGITGVQVRSAGVQVRHAGLQASLHVPGAGLQPSRVLIVRRDINAQGRSRAFVNDVLVTAATLGEETSPLVELHGQHEHQTLLDPQSHLLLLDEFAGLTASRGEVGEAFRQWKRLQSELEALRMDEREKAARLDLLKFQVGELSNARL